MKKQKKRCIHNFSLIEKRLDENGCEVYEFFCDRCLMIVVAKIDTNDKKIYGQRYNIGEGVDL